MANETAKGTTGWTLETLFVHFTTLHEDLAKLMNERHQQYKELRDMQKEAVDAALIAQKEQTAAAFIASKEAIIKQEHAQTAYNTSHNDLLKKQESMIPRPEFDRVMESVTEKIDDMRGTSSAGLKQGWGYLVGAIGIILAILGLIAKFGK